MRRDNGPRRAALPSRTLRHEWRKSTWARVAIWRAAPSPGLPLCRRGRTAPMNRHYRDTRKIDPARGATLGDNTPNDANRIEIGPTRLAFGEWAAAGLDLPDLQAMRRYRWARLTRHIVDRDYAGLLMFDPLNIRYATDTTNMQLWNAHNPFRAVLLCADGHMVLWEYKGPRYAFLSSYAPLVAEVRAGAGMFYFSTGDRSGDAARDFAAQVADILRARVGDNRRLAVDKILLHGAHAL